MRLLCPLLLASLLFVACGGSSDAPPTPTTPRADLAPALPMLDVTPSTAIFGGMYNSAEFGVRGVNFDSSNAVAWEHINVSAFFFLGAAGPLRDLDVSMHAYVFTGPMTGRLTVDLLDGRLRGMSYQLCMYLVGTGGSAPVACSTAILFE